MATEEAKATTIEEETTAGTVDAAPKAPADGICAATLFARVLEQQQTKAAAAGETRQDKGCNCKGFSKQEKARKDKGFDYKSVGK